MDSIFQDEIQAREQREKARGGVKDALTQCLEHLMTTHEGRTFLCWLIETSRYFRVSYANNAEVYRHEGMRTVGASVVELLVEARPDALHVLKQHAKEMTNG